MEKALGFSYEFDKEGQGWWIYFLPNQHFTASPAPATQFEEPVKNESVGHKTKVWVHLFKKYQEFQDRESRGGVLSEYGTLWTVDVTGQWSQSQLWVT